MLGSMSGGNFNKIFFRVKNQNKNDLPLRNWKIMELTFEEIHFNYQFCWLYFSNSFTIVWQKNCSFINWKNRTFLNQKILWAFYVRFSKWHCAGTYLYLTIKINFSSKLNFSKQVNHKFTCFLLIWTFL